MKVHEVAMFTERVDAMADFYEQLFKIKPTYRGDGIAIFHVNGSQILIHRRYVPGPDELPCENHTAYEVDQLDQTAEELIASGMKLDHPPKDFQWGRSAYLRDPDGHLIELQQAKLETGH